MAENLAQPDSSFDRATGGSCLFGGSEACTLGPLATGLLHGSVLDADRGAHLRFFRGGERDPVIFSVRAVADDADPARISFSRHVRGAGAGAARLFAGWTGVRDSQSQRVGRGTAPGAGSFPRHSADHFDGDLRPAGSRAEPDLAVS